MVVMLKPVARHFVRGNHCGDNGCVASGVPRTSFSKMIRIGSVLLAVLASAALASDAPPGLLGSWGDDAQCSGKLIKQTGTVRAEKIEITEAWLVQGGISCKLTWISTSAASGATRATANALCGEDMTRAYRLDFALHDGALDLYWDETLKNGPMHKCTKAE